MTALFTLPALVCLTAYTLIVGGLLWGNHRLHRKPKPVPEVVRATYPPPVPPTQAEIDATWVLDQPTDVWLTDELASRMCHEILAINGLSS